MKAIPYSRHPLCRLAPLDAKSQSRVKAHSRAVLGKNGRVISRYAPGEAVLRRQSRRAATLIYERGWVSGLETMARLIGNGAMEALAASNKRGESGLTALLHACKGACIEAEDYELAQWFLDMADKKEHEGD